MVSTSISKVREFDNMVNYDKKELYKLNKHIDYNVWNIEWIIGATLMGLGIFTIIFIIMAITTVLGPVKISSKFLFYIAPVILIATSLIEILLINNIQYRNDYRIINLSIMFVSFMTVAYIRSKQPLKK